VLVERNKQGIFSFSNAPEGWRDWQYALSPRGISDLVKRVFSEVFLPADYPDSVSGNYAQFTKVMVMQVFFSHVSRVFATQAMLLSCGVGMKTAIPLAAVTAWILKDGLGHLGAIAIGTLINTRFDSDPKRYRFYSSCLSKAADVMSILTLSKPEYFLLLASIGSALGRIGGSTAQSCRAKIYETFAVSGNLGDVLRCTTSQSIGAQLLGTAIGAACCPMVGGELGPLLAVNATCSVVGLSFAYVSSGLIQMKTLNLQRAELVFNDVIQSLRRQDESGMESTEATATVLSVAEVQAREVYVNPYESVFSGTSLLMNPALSGGRHHWAILAPLQNDSKYVIAVDLATRIGPTVVGMWYCEGAGSQDVLKGFFQVCLFRTILSEDRGTASTDSSLFSAQLKTTYESAEQKTGIWWPKVASGLMKSGWRSDVTFLDLKEKRIVVT
jgi:hypothetical protein